MLKFFYRLKRRRGVVLFAVIAMMTVLITMATVAYFTTRASYNTVITNYDFSQMYISTTSVSDMLIDSLLEDTSQAGTKKTGTPTGESPAEKSSHTDVELNYFTDLRDKLQTLVESGTTGGKVVGVSSNIAWADRDNLDKILADGAAYSIEPGVLDAVKVTCSLDRIDDKNPDGSAVPAGTKNYYFTLETVGFYRYNTITVQETVYEQYGTSKKGNAPAFDTFFTATGQELNNGSQDPGNRCVYINVDDITDNAYFQNKFTVFGDTRPNQFLGGIRTTGSLYLQKINCDIDAPTATSRHDWIVGGDLVIGGANAAIDLNGNDLYVKGDLYLLSTNPIKAANVYVEGNIYVSGQGKFDLSCGDAADTSCCYATYGGTKKTDLGVFVKGNIIRINKDFKSSEGTYQEGKSALVSEAKRINNSSTYTLSTMTLENELTIINSLAGTGLTVGGGNGEGYIKGGNLYQVNPSTTDNTKYGWAGTGKRLFTDGADSSPANLEASAVVWDDIAGTICVQKEGATSYENEVKVMKVSDVLDKKEGSNLQTYKYANYSVKQATVDKVLTVDFSKLTSKGITAGNSDVQSGLAYELGTVSGTSAKATITYGSGSSISQIQNINAPAIIDLPYVEGGYRLELINYPSDGIPHNGNYDIEFHIHAPNGTEKVTKDDGTEVTTNKTMPIVLTANYYDAAYGTKDEADANGNNVFSWCGSGSEITTSHGINVCLVDENDTTKSATGYVIFEMGNYEKKGSYKEYDPNVTTTETVSYVGSGVEKVGTLNQIRDAGTQSQKGNFDKSKYLSGNDFIDDHDNKIIVVSNKNSHKIAYYAKQWGTLFGYLYAPNGDFKSPALNTSIPIVGGMIVSDYNIDQSTFYYGQPDPNLMLQLGSALGTKNGTGGGSTKSVSEWNRVQIANYLG